MLRVASQPKAIRGGKEICSGMQVSTQSPGGLPGCLLLQVTVLLSCGYMLVPEALRGKDYVGGLPV